MPPSQPSPARRGRSCHSPAYSHCQSGKRPITVKLSSLPCVAGEGRGGGGTFPFLLVVSSVPSSAQAPAPLIPTFPRSRGKEPPLASIHSLPVWQTAHHGEAELPPLRSGGGPGWGGTFPFLLVVSSVPSSAHAPAPPIPTFPRSQGKELPLASIQSLPVWQTAHDGETELPPLRNG